MNAVSGGQIRRYNFETPLLTQELLARLEREAGDLGVPMPAAPTPTIRSTCLRPASDTDVSIHYAPAHPSELTVPFLS